VPLRSPRDKASSPQQGGALRRFIASGAWTGVSFACAILLGLAALLELRSGPFIAGGLGLAVYFLMAYVVPSRMGGQNQVTLDASRGTLPSEDPRVDLLVEAHQHLASLTSAYTSLPTPLQPIVAKLASDGGVITEAVTQAPEKLSAVLRFFTYYLPATADLVSDRLKLADHAGLSRLAEIDATLVRLGEAFDAFRVAVLEPDLTSVDLDITLLDDALDADLEELKQR
jgi:5-bromo-4-chloroindolyl phosphate hydrolysis protein